MFTSQFIRNLANLNKKKENAEQLLYFMEKLNIINEEVFSQANLHIKEANDETSKAINYILSFLPEAFIQKVGLIQAWGCFCTEISGISTLFSEINLNTKYYNRIHLSFDNKQKCFYADSSERNDIVTLYFKANPSFNKMITATNHLINQSSLIACLNYLNSQS